LNRLHISIINLPGDRDRFVQMRSISELPEWSDSVIINKKLLREVIRLKLNFSNIVVKKVEAVTKRYMQPGLNARSHIPRVSDGLIYVVSGSAKYNFETYSFSVKPGDVFFMGRGGKYTINVGENYIVCFIDFYLDNSSNERYESYVFDMEDTSGVYALMDKLRRKWFTHKDLQQLEGCACVYSVFALICRQSVHGYVSTKNRELMRLTHAQIEENYQKSDFTCADLFRNTGLSEVHFRRVFTQMYGVSPVKYLQAIRIAEAKRLLAETDLSVSEIAAGVGIPNLYYFCRLFKREAGETPTEFRKHPPIS